MKDGIGNYIVHGQKDAINPENKGTKVAAHYPLTIGVGESKTIRLRLTDHSEGMDKLFGKSFESVFRARTAEADAFYADIIPASLNSDQANVMRQALAGMLWSKQFYNYDVGRWLKEHGIQPYKAESALHSERSLGPHEKRRCDLHAGQMGISLVRRLGPRLACHSAHARG